MDNKTMEKIKMFAVNLLQQEAGYCGVAEMPNKAFLNSELSDGRDVKITIEVVED